MTAGAPPDGSHGPHVLVADVETPVVQSDDVHHLERVLRTRVGDPLTVGDGKGRWRPCRWDGGATPDGEVISCLLPSPRLSVAFALIKGGRPELVVQKLVELGIDDIRPFTAERSVVRWDEGKAAKNQARLDRVAREAVSQCRRVWLPTVHPTTDFASVAALPGAALADRDGGQLTLASPTVLVGPEGGWSDTECKIELTRVSLGGSVLRAETAAIAAGVLLGVARQLAAHPAG